MNTPFKMKGFGGFKSSPVKQHPRMHRDLGPGGRLTSKVSDIFETGIQSKESKVSSYTSFKPTFKVTKNINLGTKFTGEGRGVIRNPFTGPKTQAGITGKIKFGGDSGPRGRHTGFRGSLSGDVGVRDIFRKEGGEKGKIGGSAKLSLGAGTKKYNVGAFAEHSTSKHISGGGTKVGVEGKAGIVKGSVGFNIKTKKPEVKIGFDI